MIRRPPRSTLDRSSAASDVYKRQSVSNIVLENITSKKSPFAIWVKAYKHSKVKNLIIRNSRFENVGNDNLLENVENLTFEDVTINNKVIK